MQVKKFEAKSMKEALQMVKNELGPEAIILQAKTRTGSFGLGGDGSIEVTAAVSQKSLERRAVAESKLPEKVRGEFRGRTAKHQREFIDTYHDRQLEAEARPQDRRRYIDIEDDVLDRNVAGRSVAEMLADENKNPTAAPLRARPAQAESRVKGLSTQAAKALAQFIKRQVNEDEEYAPVQAPAAHAPMRRATTIVPPPQQARTTVSRPQPKPTAVSGDPWNQQTQELVNLRSEVEGLRTMLSQFQAGRPNVATHPGADYQIPYELSHAFERLTQAGIDTKYIVEILEKANRELSPLEKKKKPLVDAWVARFVLNEVNISKGWEGSKAQFHFFVGSNGSGKTTALVKLASHLVINQKKKIAIYTTDTSKVGAADQLKIYSNILGVPFEIIRGHFDYQTLPTRNRDKDFVLVDVPGFALKEVSEIDQIRNLLPPPSFQRHTHLVLSCNHRDLDAYEMMQRYQITKFDDLIVTKLDESFTHGLIYNLQRRTQKPLFAFGIGPKIPEDIEMATRERVVDLIFRISKMAK